MTTEERNKRVEEVVEIRNLLERFAERGYTDKASDLDIYRMFGTLTKEMARSMATGMTFTLHALELPEPPAYRPYLDEGTFVNPGDWQANFWKHNYRITVTEQGIVFYVNAEYEGAALDELVDFCEERYPGLVSDGADLDEDEREELFCGGNHGLYLTTDYITIKEL